MTTNLSPFEQALVLLNNSSLSDDDIDALCELFYTHYGLLIVDKIQRGATEKSGRYGGDWVEAVVYELDAQRDDLLERERDAEENPRVTVDPDESEHDDEATELEEAIEAFWDMFVSEPSLSDADAPAKKEEPEVDEAKEEIGDVIAQIVEGMILKALLAVRDNVAERSPEDRVG